MAGETVDKSSQSYAYKEHGKCALAALVCSFEAVEGELETADQYLVGYLPSGVTVPQAVLLTDDLDVDDSVALAWDVLIGATALATAIGNDTAKVGTMVFGDFITTTAKTAVYLKASTAAATAAAGTVNLAVFYVGT
jgi:hypothetical protein